MKIDLHSHTIASPDGIHSASTMVKAAKDRGLSGIAITDHDSIASWNEAVRAGKEHGIIVIRGEEARVFKGNEEVAHVLGLFLNERLKSKTMPELAEEIHRQGGLAVIAHPRDRRRSNYCDLKKYINYFDAIEVFNSHTFFNKDNLLAREFAHKNGKSITGGSDAHSKYEVGFGYTYAKANTAEEFRKAILKGKTQAYGKKTNLIYLAFSVLSNHGLYPFKEK